jgi:hypothetical protein
MSNIIPFRSGLLHEQNFISSYPPIDVLADSQSVLLRASAKSAFGVLADQLELAIVHARVIGPHIRDPKMRQDFAGRIEHTRQLLDIARRMIRQL